MQTTGNLIGFFIEFSTRMQHRHYDFYTRLIFPGMEIGRNTVSVVFDVNSAVFGYRHVNARATTGHCFINAVIDDLFY